MEGLLDQDPAAVAYRQTRSAHWDRVAIQRDSWKGWGGAYHARLREIYCLLIRPGLRVLEIGCGYGDLVGSLQAARAVGLDFSSQMVQRARVRHPDCEFLLADAHDLSQLNGPFDIIIFSDTLNDLWDVQAALVAIQPLCLPSTRLIINFHSGLWQVPLALAQTLGVAAPMLPQNWLTPEDVRGMLRLSGFETIRSWQEILWPLPVGALANKVIVRFWPFKEMALANFIVARPVASPAQESPSVSIVIPARNEAGNIKSIFQRVPSMGRETELIFVEGHSRDDTYATIDREIAAHPNLQSSLLRQTGSGKADAVRLGLSRAKGDVLLIMDADLTVRPEDLPRFYDTLCSRQGEFINGVRLVYPMEEKAMQGLNFLGNKLLSLLFSWILGQPIKDTLCGTKALWRSSYGDIAANRTFFGEFDPFGDYDLIFGAAKLNLKIVDLPIRYRERTYGTTNISRWRHGILLFRMVAVAARKLKFV